MAAVSIPAKLARQVAVYWLIALGVGAVSALLAYGLATKSPLHDLALRAVLAALALPTVLVCVRALGETLGWLSLGAVSLELPQSLQLGVPLRARLAMSPGVRTAGIGLRVRCQTISIQRSSNKTEMSRYTRWAAPLPANPTGAGLEIGFDLPADEPATEPPVRSGTYHRWLLDVKKSGFGGFSFSLDLPVEPPPPEVLEKFRAAREAHIHALAKDALAGHADAAAAEGLLPAAIAVDNGPQGLVLDFSPARYRSIALPMLCFGAIFGAMVPLFIYLGHVPGKAPPPLIFHIVFGLFGGGMLWIGIYLSGQRIRSVIDRSGIRTRSSWFSIGSERTVEADNIKSLVSSSSLRSGEKSYYSLAVVDRDGRSTTIGSGIPGEYGAQYLREIVAGKLGLEPSKVVAKAPFAGLVRR
jgi:hypothetical protein